MRETKTYTLSPELIQTLPREGSWSAVWSGGAPLVKERQASKRYRFMCQFPIWSKAGIVDLTYSPTSICAP